MNQEILDFIKSQRIGVLAVEMLDGAPHAATVHFAHRDSPFQFFFETCREYRKCEPLFGRDRSRASLVIGCDESNMRTLQLDGEVSLVTSQDDKEIFDQIYFGKFPKKKEKAEDPKYVFFSFTPSWWRFTDWTKPEGKIIITSQDATS